MNFLSIFRKKTKPVKEVVPTFTITETQYKKNDLANFAHRAKNVKLA